MAAAKQVTIVLNIAANATQANKAISQLANAAKGTEGNANKSIAGAVGASAAKTAGGGLKDVLGSIGLGEGAGGIVEALGPVGIAIGAVAIAAVGAVEGLNKFADAVVSFAGVAAPGALKRFEYASTDLEAVIGRTLVPVLNLFTEGIRMLGDFLMGVLPSMDDVAAALSPISDMFRDLSDVLAEVAPAFKMMIHDGLIVLGITLRVVSQSVKGFIQLFEKIGALLGFHGKGGALPSSVGAAPRAVSFESQDSAARKIYAAAAMSGPGPKKKTLEDLLDEDSPLAKALYATADAVNKLVAYYNRGKAVAQGAADAGTGAVEHPATGGVGLAAWALAQAWALKNGH